MKNKQKGNIHIKQFKPNQVKAAGRKETIPNIPGWAIAAVLTVTALIYIRALTNGFTINWDDGLYITGNPFIRDHSFNGIKTIFTSFYGANYFPLTTLTWWLEYTLFGLNPFPYHLLNVLLHLLNSWLVYKFIEQLSGKKITALVVCLLFALHPMHVESVAWISERKDVLYTTFFLLSLLAYLNFLNSGYRKKYFIGVILYFIASLLSKSAAVTLPIILIAIDIYRGRKIKAGSLLEKVPLLLLSVLFGVLAIFSQKSSNALTQVPFGFIDKIFFVVPHNILYYIIKLVVPFNLSAMHYYTVYQGGKFPLEYYVSLPILLGISWIIYKGVSFKKEKIFGICFFLIVLSVMLQIISVGGAFAAERYTYVASIGIFYIAGQWISAIWNRNFRNTVITVFSVYLIFISFQTWDRLGYWKNTRTLFDDVIKKYPGNYHGYLIRGICKENENDLSGALQDYYKVLERNPDSMVFYRARGFVRYSENDFKGSLEDFNQVIRLDSTICEVYNNRGMAYEGLGNMKSAMDDYSKAIMLNSEFGNAFKNRGVIKAKSGNLDEGLQDINKSIKINPKFSKAYSDRGIIKAIQKDYKGSVEDFSTAIKLKPDDEVAYYNRGNSFLYLKDTIRACIDWKKSSEMGYVNATWAMKKYCH